MSTKCKNVDSSFFDVTYLFNASNFDDFLLDNAVGNCQKKGTKPTSKFQDFHRSLASVVRFSLLQTTANDEFQAPLSFITICFENLIWTQSNRSDSQASTSLHHQD